MSIMLGNSVPGVRADRTFGAREIKLTDRGLEYLPGGKVINGTLSRDTGNTGDLVTLRPGVVMGRITATGKYMPSILGVTGVLHDTSVVTTTMTLPAATVTEIVRNIGASGTFKIIGPPTAAGTVATETVTYSAAASGTTMTITATSADFASGSIIAPTNGAETPKGILDEWVRVTDIDGNAVDCQMARLLIAGTVRADQIVYYSSLDASNKAWLKAALNAPNTGCGPIKFDDNF